MSTETEKLIFISFSRLKISEKISPKNHHLEYNQSLTMPAKITMKSKTIPSITINVWNLLSKISFHTIRTMRTIDCNFPSKICTPPSIFNRLTETIPILTWIPPRKIVQQTMPSIWKISSTRRHRRLTKRR